MAYFLVMGGLALTICFTFGWAVWRMLRWGFTRLGLGASPRGRKLAAKAPAREKGRSGAKKRPSPRDKAAEPSPPWKLTRALAALRGAWPLGVLFVALHGGGRLAAHGMAARPQQAPAAFARLVDILGWGALALVGLSLLGGLATWRCRRHG